MNYEALCTADNATLEQFMKRGTAPALDRLNGWEFCGYNTGRITDFMGIRKFYKGFYQVPGEEDRLRGYNVKVKQNGLLNPWIPLMAHGESAKHAYYDVYRPHADCDYPNALLLNYNCGRNPLWDPSQLLRDYLVCATPDSDELLVGKAYLAAGLTRIPAGFFILKRAHKNV